MSGFFGPVPPLMNWRSRSQPVPESRTEPGIVMYANAVYYPNWRVYRDQPPSSLKFEVISHVFYAFAWVKPNGTVYLSDEWADSQMEVDGTRGCLRSFAQLKRQHQHLKLILSIGGGGHSDNFAAIASNPVARDNLAQSARGLVDIYGLDGIDIDWEHPSDVQQGMNYIHLLAAIRAYLPSPRYLLTSALPAGEWALRYIDLNIASNYLNFMNLMTYDFSGPWVDSTGHHAQLKGPQRPHNAAAALSCQSAVDYVRSQGVNSKKILLGVPVYGRSFLGATNIGQSFTGQGGEEGTFEYKDLPRPGAIESVDERVGAAFCVGEDGGFVTYDNPQTVAMKAKYASQNKLGGLFYWTATADGKDSRSLIETGFTKLHDLG
ncbi:MAG: hypothetical protein M1827_004342 [Pycnora praestabilis]|nr:MAG: hypothetical protein M1827_004342 [Pycnora praestabilis]